MLRESQQAFLQRINNPACPMRTTAATLAIQWPLEQLSGAEPSLAEKDAEAPLLDVLEAANEVFA